MKQVEVGRSEGAVGLPYLKRSGERAPLLAGARPSPPSAGTAESALPIQIVAPGMNSKALLLEQGWLESVRLPWAMCGIQSTSSTSANSAAGTLRGSIPAASIIPAKQRLSEGIGFLNASARTVGTVDETSRYRYPYFL